MEGVWNKKWKRSLCKAEEGACARGGVWEHKHLESSIQDWPKGSGLDEVRGGGRNDIIRGIIRNSSHCKVSVEGSDRCF